MKPYGAFVAAFLCTLSSSLPTARAEATPVTPVTPVTPAARKVAEAHFAIGKAHLDAGQYDEAVIEFNAAFRFSGAENVYFFLGEALRLKGSKEDALGNYKSYIAAKAGGSKADEARKHIEDLTKALSDEKAATATPLAARVAADPVRPQEVATATSQPMEREAREGQRHALDAPAQESAPVTPHWDAEPPAVPVVPVSFNPKSPTNTYLIALGGQSCVSPCTLLLLPGTYQLGIRGSGQFEQQLKVPAAPSLVRIQHKNTGYYIGGGITFGLGAGLLTAGGLLFGRGDTATITGLLMVLIAPGPFITGLVYLAKGGSNAAALTTIGPRAASFRRPAGYQLAGLALSPLWDGRGTGVVGGMGGATFVF